MINSPWQADDDADNQSGDNRGDSAHTSISLTVPPAWILQSGCQPYARTDHNQRPAVKPRYCCNGRLPDGYHHDQSPGKAPRSSICCIATASWLFGEKSFSQAAAVGNSTNGKEAGACPAPVDLSFGFHATSLRGWSSKSRYFPVGNDARQTMISGFSDVRYQFPPDHAITSITPMPIIDFTSSSLPAFLACSVW